MKIKTSPTEALYLESGTDVPNNPDLPVLLYRKALGEDTADKAAAFEERFSANGWGGIWRDGIYDYHHFHPDAHEVLGIAQGRVTVQFGGKNGQTMELNAGDLVVLPAGTGHRRLAQDGELVVIGAYPGGQQDYDLCRSVTECRDAKQKIATVPLPETDPLFGVDGPLLKIWNSETADQ